jgi:hypothetical protein
MAHLDALNEVHDRMGIELCETRPGAGFRFADGSMVGPAAKRSELAHEQDGAQYERGGRVRHPIPEEIPMTEKPKFTHTQPGGFVEEDERAEDGMENDSLGTIDIADSTGTDEKKETGDAKDQNQATRED